MVDSSRAIPVELAQSHFFDFFDAGFVTLRILRKQLSPDVLHAVPILFQLQQRGDHLRLEIGGVVMCVKTFREALGTFFAVEDFGARFITSNHTFRVSAEASGSVSVSVTASLSMVNVGPYASSKSNSQLS